MTSPETSIGSSHLPLKHLGDWAHTTLSRQKAEKIKRERKRKNPPCGEAAELCMRDKSCSYDKRKYTLMKEVVLPADGINSIQLH